MFTINLIPWNWIRHIFSSNNAIFITVIFLDIYIDVLVVVNCYICWMMLSAAALITHIYISPRLKVMATLLGGASSLVLLLPSETPLQRFAVIVIKVFSLFAIIYIAFYKQNPKKILVAAFVYLGINLLLGGAVYLAKTVFGNDIIYSNNGILYFDISLTNLIVVTALIYIALVVLSRLHSRYSDKNHSYRVEFSLGDENYSLCAVADTGNLAKDIFSGKPVIVCTGISLYKDGSAFAPIPVPYSTIAGEGILYAVRPSRICIVDESKSRLEVDALVAGIESESGECRAIFNPNIL